MRRAEQLLHRAAPAAAAAEIAAPSVAPAAAVQRCGAVADPDAQSAAAGRRAACGAGRRRCHPGLWLRSSVRAPVVVHLASGARAVERLDRLSIAEQSLLSVPPSPELLACNLDSSASAPGAGAGRGRRPVRPRLNVAAGGGADSKPDEGDSMCDVPEAVTCSGHEQVLQSVSAGLRARGGFWLKSLSWWMEVIGEGAAWPDGSGAAAGVGAGGYHLILHGLAMLTMAGLLLPTMPGDRRRSMATAIAILAAHPWRFRLGGCRGS